MATLLIIDDDPGSLKLLHSRLEKTGYRVVEARDGQEGLRIAQTGRVDLVILDVRIPKIDGWEVCRTLKSNPETNEMPVVMLTGCSQDAQELYGRQCGADDYITKPWDAKRLLQIVSSALNRSKAAHEIRSEAMQQRAKHFVQRLTQVAGKLSQVPNAESMRGQLIRLATSFIANYQAALQAATPTSFLTKLKTVDEQFGELIFWLGLLRDSNLSGDSEVPLLVAEGRVLQRCFGDQLRNANHRL